MRLSKIGLQAFADFINLSKVQVGGLYYYLDVSKMEARVTSKTGKNYSGNIIIPYSFDYNSQSHKVTSIGADAFMRCSGLTSVTIPNSVTSIGTDAFYYCI